jgi:hypothetical protein
MAKKKTKRKKRRSRKPTEEYTHLGIQLDDYKVRAEAEINHLAYGPEYAWRDPDEEPLYEFETHLELFGVCVYPEERAGDRYALMIYSELNPESRIYWKLQDIQEVDEFRARKYRTYRGKEIPVYLPPKGMGTLEKERGEPAWHGTIWAQPRYVNDLLVVLGHERQLYLAINERKIERQRWIRGISVQTTDPAEE